MRLRVPFVAVLVVALGAPSTQAAPRSWYEYYLNARDRLIPNKRYPEAIASLEQAIKLKPDSALEEQTYGLQFIDYFPYFYQAKCYLALGDYNSTIRFLNFEQVKGKIQLRSDKWTEWNKLRAAALAQQAGAESEDKVKRLTREVATFRAQAVEQHKAGNLDDALASLAKAQELAKQALDRQTQTEIAAETQRIISEKTREDAARDRRQRIAGELAEGTKLLQDGQAAVAKLKFESVLTLDPANAAALAGKQRAEDEILASTTRENRDALLQEGRRLFEAGRYEDAQRPLAEAASDKDATEAQDLLVKARKYVEGVRQAKETRTRVDQLLAEAEGLMAERRYADAWVRFGSVLALDSANAAATERQRMALRLTGDELFDKYFPNVPPVLNFLFPSGEGTVISASTEGGRTIEVIGTALDDRGLARIQFLQGGKVVGEQDLLAAGDTLTRYQRIAHTFELAKGANDLKVVAIDTLGAEQSQAFLVTRNLLLIEKPWFLPSAVASAAGLVGLGLAVQRTRRRRAVRNRFNPYIAGAPVLEDDMFFGRHKLLARIMNVLHHNSLMITGERRIGKTTLLHHLRKALEHDEGTDYQFFAVSTDLQGVPEAAFFDAVMTDVAEQLPLRAETREALRFRRGRETYDGRDFSHDLQRVVEDLTQRTTKKVKLALLIDEVDVLNEYSERVNQRLRSIFMKTFSEHLVAIMSGVGIKRIWKSEGSPWYNFFDEIELTAFTREEAEALVRQPVEGVFRWTPEAVEAILEYSGLKPYVIQKFCIHAVNQMLEEGRTTITAADVEAVRPLVLFERAEEIIPVPESAHA
jgi:tetratricopeptide (TPR) repeat protein